MVQVSVNGQWPDKYRLIRPSISRLLWQSVFKEENDSWIAAFGAVSCQDGLGTSSHSASDPFLTQPVAGYFWDSYFPMMASEAGSWAKYRSSGSACAGYFAKDFQEKGSMILLRIVTGWMRLVWLFLEQVMNHLRDYPVALCWLSTWVRHYLGQSLIACIRLHWTAAADFKASGLFTGPDGTVSHIWRTAWGYLSGQSGHSFLSIE